MPIEFTCDKCGRVLRVPDGSEGRQCQCPACDRLMTIPDAVTASGKQSDEPAGQIRVTCPKCQYPLRCKSELKGTKGQCKQCKHIFVIGDDSPERASSSESLVFSCPACNQLFDGRSEMEGRKGKCHACGEVFVIHVRPAEVERQPVIKKSVKPFSSPTKKTASPKPTAATQRPLATAPNLQLICGSCQGQMEVPASAAGQTTACPYCHQLLQVPAAGATKPTDTLGDGQVLRQTGENTHQSTTGKRVVTETVGWTSQLPSTAFDNPGWGVPTGPSQPSGFAFDPRISQPTAYESPYSSSATSVGVLQGSIEEGADRNRLRSIAGWQRQVMLSIIWSFIISFGLIAVVGLLLLLSIPGSNGQSPIFALGIGIAVLFFLPVAIGLAIWGIVAYAGLCLSQYDSGKATLFLLGYFAPAIGIVFFFLAIVDARAEIRRHGYHVGFFGLDKLRI